MSSFNGNGKVNDFLERMQAQCPKKRDDSKLNQKTIQKIFMNYRGNFGRYQILPIDSLTNDYPFQMLNNTYELNVKRRSKAADGSEVVSDAWLRLYHPDSDAYLMKDMTGRTVSSLTAADMELIAQARGLFDELWEELDGRNNREEYVTTLLRKRNYTIFFGYCLNYWANDSRTPTKQNFPALFVVTAKSFIQAVQSNIEEKAAMEGGDVSWISNIYNRNASGRDGFLVFSVTNDPTRVGYICTASHDFGKAKALENVVIPNDDLELMTSPVETFIGWQAPRALDGDNSTNRRLFNPAIYKEAIQVLSELLAGIRSAKALGTDVKDAIDSTIAKTLAAQPSKGFSQTNDPVLAAQAEENGEFSPNQGADPTRLVQNTTPESVGTNPSSATLDPINGPVNNQPASNPFGQPAQPQQPAGGSPFGGSPFGSNFGQGFGGGFPGK